MSAKRKQSAVLRPLRSEDLELVSRGVRGDVGRAERLARRLRRGVAEDPPRRWSRCRDQVFRSACAPRSRGRLKARVGDLTMNQGAAGRPRSSTWRAVALARRRSRRVFTCDAACPSDRYADPVSRRPSRTASRHSRPRIRSRPGCTKDPRSMDRPEGSTAVLAPPGCGARGRYLCCPHSRLIAVAPQGWRQLAEAAQIPIGRILLLSLRGPYATAARPRNGSKPLARSPAGDRAAPRSRPSQVVSP